MYTTDQQKPESRTTKNLLKFEFVRKKSLNLPNPFQVSVLKKTQHTLTPIINKVKKLKITRVRIYFRASEKVT